MRQRHSENSEDYIQRGRLLDRAVALDRLLNTIFAQTTDLNHKGRCCIFARLLINTFNSCRLIHALESMISSSVYICNTFKGLHIEEFILILYLSKYLLIPTLKNLTSRIKFQKNISETSQACFNPNLGVTGRSPRNFKMLVYSSRDYDPMVSLSKIYDHGAPCLLEPQ